MKAFLFTLLLGATATAADETVTYRVTGLFSRDREADLRSVIENLPAIKLVSIDFDHAEAVFIYDPEVAFKGTRHDEILRRFDEEVRTESNNTFTLQPLCTTPKEQLTSVEIPIIGLDCKACSFAAYEIVAKIDGVAQATASFKEGRVTALIDPAKTSREALAAALRKREVRMPKSE